MTREERIKHECRISEVQQEVAAVRRALRDAIRAEVNALIASAGASGGAEGGAGGGLDVHDIGDPPDDAARSGDGGD